MLLWGQPHRQQDPPRKRKQGCIQAVHGLSVGVLFLALRLPVLVGVAKDPYGWLRQNLGQGYIVLYLEPSKQDH
jgi:hypothetical protein